MKLVQSDAAMAGPLLKLYRGSFDPATLDPEPEFLADIAGEGLFRVVVAVEEEPVGFLRFRDLPQTGVRFLVHLAVAPEKRGDGVGRELVRWVLDEVPTPAILEVERVEDATDPQDRAVRERRLRWFAQQGATVLTSHYTQPALSPVTEPVPLNLLAFRAEMIADRGAMIQAFYREQWGLSPDHPYVRGALR